MWIHRIKKENTCIEKKTLCPVFCIGPHGLINTTADVFLAKTPGKESLCMSDPSLTVLRCGLLASSIHGLQEGHLGMWVMVIDPPSRRWKLLTLDMEMPRSGDRFLLASMLSNGVVHTRSGAHLRSWLAPCSDRFAVCGSLVSCKRSESSVQEVVLIFKIKAIFKMQFEFQAIYIESLCVIVYMF